MAAGGRPLVLVVDDYNDSREICAEFLSFSGFSVAEARSGEEALEKALELLPDLIVMDVTLPGMDGTAATRRLKNDRRTSAIPVLGMSGWKEDGRTVFDAYLVKPIRPEALLGHVRRLLERVRAREK